MQGQSARPVKTFTIGFHEASHNEAQYAKAVATHLGTDHTELYVSPDEAMNVVPLLPTIYDEPFADPSQIPTFLVSHLARQSVTVSLSGDGGDELFSGYTRYAWGQATWDRIARLPPSVRKAVGVTLGSISADGWTRATETLEPVLPSWIKRRTRPERIHRTLALISAPGPEARYDIISTSWNGGRSIVRGGNVTTHALNDPRCWAKIDDFTACMMYLDTISYLPDDILVKVDRASMAVSLEARAPYLDHRIVEFAWSLPKLLKVREGQGKWIMRRLLDRYVPREMIERPKQGFGVPIDTWLREPLRPWAEALLAEDRLAAEGFLDPAPVRKKWKEHLNGERNWQYHLWQVLMFQAWLEAERTSSGLMTKSEQLVHHL
jgi:asparagine synthase (glutamine-hydrolysing)